MKPIGAFMGHDALREYGTQLMDEYGIEYVHMHLPIFLDAVKELYIEIGPQPEGIERGAYEELRKLIGELRDIGLKFFVSYPVFSRPQIAQKKPEYSAWTLLKKSHSTRACPTNSDVLRRIVADLRSFIRLYGVEGVMLDFIRFESPMAGFDFFLTCFCQNCQDEMRMRGYDPESIKGDWLKFTDLMSMGNFAKGIVEQGALSASDVLELYNEFPGIFEWFRYRNEYIEEVIKIFASAIREEGGRGTVVGANLLSPWWSLLAGQSYRVLSRILDVIEPMLYFDWMQWEGLTAVKELSLTYGMDKDLLTRFYYVTTGLSTVVQPRSFDETRLSGLPSGSVEASLHKITSWNVGKAKIWPVIMVSPTDTVHYLLGERISNLSMINKEFFVENVKSAVRGHADGLVYFYFDRAEKDVLRELYAVWRSETND